MEIERSNYWQRLPSILQAISEAQFISIDLEMSGIATGRVKDAPTPSLQQLYANAKAAAQTYNILQVGLTCIAWSDDKKAYVTKTFNTPLALGIIGGNQYSDQLSSKIERQIGFSSKTIAFLQSNDFKFSNVFDKGVPYLSAMEARHDDLAAFLENREDCDYISIRNCPHETGQFYKTMRSQIQAWVNTRVFEPGFKPLMLTNPYNGRFHRHQKRLVRQLIDTEFPGYKVRSRDGSSYMEVAVNASSSHQTLKELRRQAVAKQYGFAHVWDAMTGQTFATKIDKGLIHISPTQRETGEEDIGSELFEYERRIKKNQPIVVGHNMLWDLCFLYHTFVGTLPETVDEFQKRLREKMPRIVDTKYLFTRGHHEMMPDQSLEECFAQVRGAKILPVLPDECYSYGKPVVHQAGYDSYMTAIVFLKKAHQISQTKKGFEYIPAEDHEETKPVPLFPFTSHATLRIPKRPVHNGHHIPAVLKQTTRRDTNSSGSLLDNDNNNLASLDAKFKPMIPTSSFAPEMGSTKLVEKVQENSGEENDELAKLPDWTDEQVFWTKYGNKVRGGRAGVLLCTGPKRVVI